jgi:hypothetical protein
LFPDDLPARGFDSLLWFHAFRLQSQMDSHHFVALFEDKRIPVPFSPKQSVRDVKSLLAAVLKVAPEDLRMALETGVQLSDDRAMAEYKLKPMQEVRLQRVVSLRDVVKSSAALVVRHAPTVLFISAVPFVLYFGLRRRGLTYRSLLDALRLPFVE